MRIEFYTDRESPAELRLIIQICEAGIAAHAKREAEWKDKAAQEYNKIPALVAADVLTGAANGQGVAVMGETRTFAGQAVQAQNLPKLPPIGTVDETTGELFVNRNQNAAAAAFGGGAAALDSIGNPPVPAPAVAPPAGAPDAGTTSTNPPASTIPAGNVSPAATVDRDKAGVPWDARIHSEAKTKNNDGTWRYKRKLDDAVKAAVLAEIAPSNGSASGAANNVPASSSVPPLPPPPPPPVTLPPAGGTVATPVPLPPPPPPRVPDAPVAGVVPPPVNPTSAPPAPPAASPSATAGTSAPVGASLTSGGMDYRSLIIKLNKAIAAGHVTQESLVTACRELGIGDSPAALGAPQNAHLVKPLHDRLFPNG